MSFRVDEAEMQALSQSELSNEARVLYLLGLRPFMDFATGLVGVKRRISFQMLREVVEVRRPRGSTKADYLPGIEDIRWLLAELERLGLVERMPKARRTDPMVYRLPLAVVGERGSFTQNEEPQRNPKGGTPKGVPGDSTAYGNTTPKGTPNEEPHTSGSPVIKEKEEADARASAPLASSSAKRKTLQTLDEYAAACKAAGVKLIPETDPVFAFADSAGIPHDWLYLCWREFARRCREQGKRQRDWPQTFRNCVRGNWYGLWKVARNGSVFLTSEGELIRREFEAKEEAA